MSERGSDTYLVDSAVQVCGGSRLSVDTDDVTVSLGKVRHSLLGMHNHLHHDA